MNNRDLIIQTTLCVLSNIGVPFALDIDIKDELRGELK